MPKHLVEIDSKALAAAHAELGTATIKDTVNQALRIVGQPRPAAVETALEVLARADLGDRAEAWR